MASSQAPAGLGLTSGLSGSPSVVPQVWTLPQLASYCSSTKTRPGKDVEGPPSLPAMKRQKPAHWMLRTGCRVVSSLVPAQQ